MRLHVTASDSRSVCAMQILNSPTKTASLWVCKYLFMLVFHVHSADIHRYHD